eukprot:CAMPEP_0168504398 /NCGR_PEP_ID=MMETSP0228-20121227/76347_1 /TAXON_ID=133427 /ORGANISM="Protoceratium reticulatum, Strain CCCM 535 (=CCMP 1889)" /LENGTH=63 /DNA_ID=CAMNT_0008521477 /DNA_START=23 /DNA_END=211 /DNA_ORIENTATION=-
MVSTKGAVYVGGELAAEVDLAACAPASELFAGLLQRGDASCRFARFPGGAELLGSAVAWLSRP